MRRIARKIGQALRGVKSGGTGGFAPRGGCQALRTGTWLHSLHVMLDELGVRFQALLARLHELVARLHSLVALLQRIHLTAHPESVRFLRVKMASQILDVFARRMPVHF